MRGGEQGHREVLQVDWTGLSVPDFLSVLLDGSVAAELAGADGVEDGLFGPFFLVFVGFVDLN